jgi:competence protein ComFC
VEKRFYNMKPSLFFNKTKEFILDILFPKFCLNCGREGQYLCPDCFFLVGIMENQYCLFCKIPKVVVNGRTCLFCRRERSLDGLLFSVPYENRIIKKLISKFKYGSAKDLATTISFFALWHLELSGKWGKFSDFYIIPAPLHPKKLKARGFNQSEEIAKKIALFTGLPILEKTLLKIKNTAAQAELNKEQRQKNLKGAFLCAQPETIKDKKIILIDDVFTTGATMEECASTLKKAGAKEVWGLAIARG